jgi:ATP/maltotriose-dependent transcriptional regulator MalT/DNA-binding SARP family transcriptional activator
MVRKLEPGVGRPTSEASHPPPAVGDRPRRKTRRRRPVTDDTPISNANGLFGPGFPVQLTKVQRPPLRTETLSRERLLDWLAARIQQRLVFISAEAGYGKTTLIADFARRTRVRIIWYRIDEQDRDWVAVLNYLVAAGRELDAGFAPTTAALLGDIGTGAASRERVVETFLRELKALGGTRTVLFLDDWHLVDGVADVRELMRQVVLQAPERMSFVFSSRVRPNLSVARYRALGEVAELTTDDLRFSEREIERLFRDTYGRPLEADVVNDLSQRTEGWAACLQLVQAALRDRTPTKVRAFVQGLSGIDENLYDYLAEEVVGELDDEMQQFLMQTSILRVVDPELTEVLTGFDAARARRLIEAAEKIGLLSRRGEATRHSQRYHTLVRQFLEERLRRTVGDERVRELHRAVARHADGTNWRLAAHHYEAAGDIADVHRVIESSALEIMSAADYSAVADWLDRYPPATERSIHRIARSRVRYYGDRLDQAVEDAEEAARLAESEGGLAAELAQLNLVGQRFNLERGSGTVDIARSLMNTARDPAVSDIARAYVLMADVNRGLPIRDLIDHLAAMGDRQLASNHPFFAGVTFVNLAVVYQDAGEHERARRIAERALDLLQGERSPESAAAEAVLGWTYAYEGDESSAIEWLNRAISVEHRLTRAELIGELADIQMWFGTLDEAQSTLKKLESLPAESKLRADHLLPTRVEYLLRRGRVEEAAHLLSQRHLDGAIWATQGTARLRYLSALTSWMTQSPSWLEEARLAERILRDQGMALWHQPCRLLAGIGDSSHDVDAVVGAIGLASPASLRMAAEIVMVLLPQLSSATRDLVVMEALRRPKRWRQPMRDALGGSNTSLQIFAARLLDQIGESQDVAVLRGFVKNYKIGPPDTRLGKGLARQLAPRVFVEDLGRVRLQIGSMELEGSSIRRKVLALLCFLLTRPGFSVTRDQVLEALWPDLEPEVAANSLHQTVYFLRRVFEPAYKEDLSADYVHHEADILWLDQGVIGSRSASCAERIADIRAHGDAMSVESLSDAYRGLFALDFVYEDWAASYRASLHGGYVEIVEHNARLDAESGHIDRSILLLTRALEVDPDADQLELLLLKVYRQSGAFAAASERYEHYATFMREQLGVEPPRLDAL